MDSYRGDSTKSTSGFRQVKMSQRAAITRQPLNDLCDNMEPSKSVKSNLRLSIGDPTVDGNLKVPSVVVDAVCDVVRSGDFNGYPPTSGYDDTRQVVVEYMKRFCKTEERRALLTWENVLMASGVSHAVEMAITTLCNPGENILLCVPVFPQYQSICRSHGIEYRPCVLKSDEHWEVDLSEAAKLIDDKTRGFIVINPSNPCGSNWRRSHVKEIIHFCEEHQLPLVSDEIYAELVFGGDVFTSVADFDTDVPRLVLGGIAKHLVSPGWRIGWSVLLDRAGVAAEWQTGMMQFAQLLCGPNSVCQEAVARSLLKVAPEHAEKLCVELEKGAAVYKRLLEHDIGIAFDPPHASMFVMMHIDYDYFKDIGSDMEFYEKLLDEENVQVLPGSIFGVAGFVRATTSRPPEIINEAIDRIIEFCERHKK